MLKSKFILKYTHTEKFEDDNNDDFSSDSDFDSLNDIKSRKEQNDDDDSERHSLVSQNKDNGELKPTDNHPWIIRESSKPINYPFNLLP